MGALEFLCDRRFHQTFTVPPSPDSGRFKLFRVSYADFGDPQSKAVVLFCGALMGTRFTYSPLDQLAKANRVRIIHPDRPGIGGSDAVDQHDRISTWLDMIPHLLARLGVKHVSIASHSGGIIYALNTILTYPHILHPTKPYITFFAPWVHPLHSGITHLKAAEFLPAPVIGRFVSVARFVNNNVMPLAGLSSSFIHGIMDSFSPSTPTPAPAPLTPTLSRTSLRRSLSREGSHSSGLDLDDPEIVEELRQLIVTYLFAESIDGISDDAKLFLKKPSSIPWCSPSIFWSDIDYVVPLLSKMITEESGAEELGRKWNIDAFHAEIDDMVGAKGRIWFDDCWTFNDPHRPSSMDQIENTKPKVETKTAGHEQRNDAFEYRSKVVSGSEHNYLMDPAYGAAGNWLERVWESFRDEV
ncbi:hypothetical protein K469DRAFT_365310 [Zopfia rhizophila CBS 207.26]|uniref:Alpha/beta-hydrolase n=1 Tax=Zopfia rhizophila CBS 207.26 TaxID=1314779 RepID=A0A6A6EMI0_9PEZI|nr:hypothetical protein K469DRAFT_365310 [Zopfia rhizophila CBS 207.26]